jgi:hypothetical protein
LIEQPAANTSMADAETACWGLLHQFSLCHFHHQAGVSVDTAGASAHGAAAAAAVAAASVLQQTNLVC